MKVDMLGRYHEERGDVYLSNERSTLMGKNHVVVPVSGQRSTMPTILFSTHA